MDLAWFDQLAPYWQTAIQLACLIALSLALGWLLAWVVQRIAAVMRKRIQGNALDARVVQRLTQALPSVLIQAGMPLFAGPTDQMNTVVRNVAMALTVLHLVRAASKLLDVYLETHLQDTRATGQQQRSIKSYVQLAQLMLAAVGAVVIVASLIDRSPLIVLSGMGAMSAVLMLVFKDTILSFTAGVQITSNDLVRLGDWIEMPQAGADGAVIDIALNTIRVQNWDLTITTIPTWRFMSESFKNWRGMEESGGRRIKRSLLIDAASVKFLDEPALAKLNQIQLLSPYLVAKSQAVNQTNAQRRELLGERAAVPGNQRRLTNLGTFRAYVLALLQADPDIHQDRTLIVRLLEPSAAGIPLEVYAFTRITAWSDFERIQSDLFDHLLAILPQFGLHLYQSPSGMDMQNWRPTAAELAHT